MEQHNESARTLAQVNLGNESKKELILELRTNARKRPWIGGIKLGLAVIFGISLYNQYSTPDILTKEDGLRLIMFTMLVTYFFYHGIKDRKGNPRDAVLADILEKY